MVHTLEVKVDQDGQVRPLAEGVVLPQGRAVLLWHDDESDFASLSESAFADWLRPEEDEAWKSLQQDR